MALIIRYLFAGATAKNKVVACFSRGVLQICLYYGDISFYNVAIAGKEKD